MATVTESIDLTAAPEAVWALVGDPASLSDWHPAVATAEVTDGVRRCALAGGGGIVEPILEHSDQERFYMYGLTESPLPVHDCRSRVSVEATAGGSRLVWSAEFEPDDPAAAQELSEMVSGLYSAGLAAVRDRLD